MSKPIKVSLQTSKTVKIIFVLLVIVLVGLVFFLTSQKTFAPEDAADLPNAENSDASGTMLNDDEREDDDVVLTWTIAPYRQDCVGVGPQQCLVVNNEYFYDRIDGFAFEEGYEYVISVERTRREQPGPADQNQFSYTLIDVISKKDVRPEPEDEVISLDDTSWQWRETVYADESVVTAVDSSQFTVQFGEESFGSTTDCNTLAGAYIISGNTIQIGPLAATKKACPGATQEFEYAQMLEQVAQFYISDDGELVLTLSEDGGSMFFEPVPATTE